MNTILRFCITAVALFLADCCKSTPAQGQVFTDKEDFFLTHAKQKSYSIDTAANAVVLYEKGVFSLAKQTNGSWYLVKTVRKIIKIINKDGIHYADVAVRGVRSWQAEIRSVTGKTYNFDGGKLVAQQLDKKAVKTETIGDDYFVTKFSLPSVKEGSVIDYSYEIMQGVSYVFGEWRFQESIPKLQSEITLMHKDDFDVLKTMPNSRDYVHFEKPGIHPDSVVLDAYTTPAPTLPHYKSQRWVRKNIPAYISEPYVYDDDNYTEMLIMEVYDRLINNWETYNYNSLNSIDEFAPKKTKEDLQRLVKQIIGAETDSLIIARKIHKYVVDSFSKYDNDEPGVGSLTTVITSKRGDYFQLTALLYKLYLTAGFDTKIIVVGSRDRMTMNNIAPSHRTFGGSVCRMKINGNYHYAEAVDNTRAFDVLDPLYYNGFCWTVDTPAGKEFELPVNGIKEKHAVFVKTENAEMQNYVLNIKEHFGNVTAGKNRKEWQDDKQALKNYVLDRVNGLPGDAALVKYTITGLTDADSSLVLEYNVKLDLGTTPAIYFEPALFRYFISNPFTAASRVHPIEMQSTVDFIFSMNLQLPANYTIEESPKSVSYKLDEENTYKYLAEYKQADHAFLLNTRLIMNRNYFQVIEYAGLKDFFEKIVQQQQKPMLIKKL